MNEIENLGMGKCRNQGMNDEQIYEVMSVTLVPKNKSNHWFLIYLEKGHTHGIYYINLLYKLKLNEKQIQPIYNQNDDVY